jgi:indole-3-pyruvate monooxygenase
METHDAVVIGAGFAGLGTAAALRAKGVRRFVVLEQGGGVGHFWTQTYDRLHLHSAFHDMPNDGGLRARYPVFLPRDQLIDYFRRYADLHGLAEHFRFGTRVGRVERVDPAGNDGHEWELDTSKGRVRARYVAVATATNRVPKSPVIPGRERFRGSVLHSAEYRNAAPFAGRSVLVVGSGNSAAEICLDLVQGGALEVSMWVREPRHFIPLSRMALLFRLFRLLGQFTDAKKWQQHRIEYGTPEFERTIAMRDRMASLLSVDLSRYGIRKPRDGPMEETFRKGRIPTFDQGAIPLIRRGAIRVIDGNVRPIVAFEEEGVRLGDEVECLDSVIFATGFEPGLDEFIADPELLGPVRFAQLVPLTDGRTRSRVYPSIFFPSFEISPLGGISLGRFGWEAGERIADALGADTRSR